MNNKEKYRKVFQETFEISGEQIENAEYTVTAGWDSVGHMTLVAALEDEFDIMMDTDDIIDFSSFEVGKQILKKYDVLIDE